MAKLPDGISMSAGSIYNGKIVGPEGNLLDPEQADKKDPSLRAAGSGYISAAEQAELDEMDASQELIERTKQAGRGVSPVLTTAADRSDSSSDSSFDSLADVAAAFRSGEVSSSVLSDAAAAFRQGSFESWTPPEQNGATAGEQSEQSPPSEQSEQSPPSNEPGTGTPPEFSDALGESAQSQAAAFGSGLDSTTIALVVAAAAVAIGVSR